MSLRSMLRSDSEHQSESLVHAFVRGLVLGTGAVISIATLSLGGITLASGATGGDFGTALNAILASGDWKSPGTGIVKNADNLGGEGAEKYLKLQAQECDPGYAISQIKANGEINCTKVTP